MVNFFYEDDFNLSLNKKEVRFWIKNVVKKENKKLSYLNFVFCTDSYLLELNQKYPEIAEKLKYPLDSKEFAIISKIINMKSFKLARDSELSLLQNANVAGIYAFNSDYKILALGYMSNNAEDCRKLRAITISKLGKHLMLIEDSSLSEQLSWKSQDNLYTFFNQFSSDGIDLESVCGYMISSK